jgi:hypothetical protein
MKRYNLNETWELCLKMWKWIAKEKKKKRWHSPSSLKCEWLNNNGFRDIHIACTCFFCHYSAQHGGSCNSCPGRKVDPDFNCMTKPDYVSNPIEFYKLLLALNRKRKKK